MGKPDLSLLNAVTVRQVRCPLACSKASKDRHEGWQGVGSYPRAGENGPCPVLATHGRAQVNSAELDRGPLLFCIDAGGGSPHWPGQIDVRRNTRKEKTFVFSRFWGPMWVLMSASD